MNLERRLLWLVALLEGFAVMVLESMCAKYLAPVYGDTLQVWGVAVGMTLGGLCLGYFAGSWAATRYSKRVWELVVVAASIMLLSPALAQAIIPQLISGDILRDSLIVTASLLLPPLILMGMVPTMLVARLSSADNAGKVAGRVFGISTIGSIMGIFLTGFYLVPSWGVVLPLLAAALLLVLPSAGILITRRSPWPLLPAAAAAFGFWHHAQQGFPANGSLKVHYFAEGVLGQVMVGDFGYQAQDGQQRLGRAMYVNRMPQTIIDHGTGQPLFSPYIDYLDEALQAKPGGDVLLLGLGGGNLVRRFTQQGRSVQVCDLDPRVVHASRTYFLSDTDDGDTRYVVDDARHHLRSTSDQFDIVVFDLFKGENPPHHAFTLEAFRDTRKVLKPGGWVVVNFLGRTTGPHSLGPRAVAKTLLEAGCQVEVIAIPDIDNVIVLASADAPPQISDHLRGYAVPLQALALAEVPVLRDDLPTLEFLHAETAHWNRNWYNEHYTSRYLKERIPLFR